jgi:hypothetical protein
MIETLISNGTFQGLDRFDQLEAEIAKLSPVEAPLVHYFSEGLYAREMTIPAGAMLTGKIHKTEHICVISKGDITFFDQNGGARRVKAPYTFVSKPGARRAGYAHEETVWTCFHVTPERDLEKLEELLIEKYDNPLLTSNTKTPCLGQP